MRPGLIARVIPALLSLSLVAGCAVGAPARGSHPSASSAPSPRTLTGSLQGASYIIQVPGSWNGVLLLYSHGGGALTPSAAAENTIDPVTSAYLLEHGYALAGSSFRSSGWFVEDALVDDLALLGEFRRLIGRPTRTIAWGVSLGTMVTLGLAERNPDRIDGALAMCGVLADAVPFWNQNLDAAFAFNVLFAENDPQIRVTGADPSTSAGGICLAPERRLTLRVGRGCKQPAVSSSLPPLGRSWWEGRVRYSGLDVRRATVALRLLRRPCVTATSRDRPSRDGRV